MQLEKESKLKEICKYFQIYYTKNGKKVKFCISDKNENNLNVFAFRKIKHISQKLKKLNCAIYTKGVNVLS